MFRYFALKKQDKNADMSAGVQKEISARVQKETVLEREISKDLGPVVERRCWGLGDRPELAPGMMDEGDA